MNLIHLKGITRQGTLQIAQSGTQQWRILERRGLVPFSSLLGPWYLITPHIRLENGKVLHKWVHAVFDPHFQIVQSA